MKQVLIILGMILILIPAVSERTKNQQECINQEFQGFAYKQNKEIYCYKVQNPCPEFGECRDLEINTRLPLKVYSLDGKLTEVIS